MKSPLKNRIQSLTESKNEEVKKIANELLLAIDVYESQNKDISGLIKKKLNGVQSEETTELMNYVDNKFNVDNIGVLNAIRIFEKSKRIKNDPELKRLVNAYSLELETGVPEHMLVKSFIKNFANYKNINEAAYEVYHTISQNYDKNKAHQLVANAIYILENDENSEFLQDIVKSLNMAFNLPGSHVKGFVHQALKDRIDMHPALGALVEELRLIDSKTQTKIDYYQDRNGRVSVSKRLSPTLEHKEDKEISFLIGNNIFVAGEKTLRKATKDDMKRINEHGDGERFIEVCRVVTNFKINEDKMDINDGVNNFTIKNVFEAVDKQSIKDILKDFEGKYQFEGNDIKILDQESEEKIGDALDAAGYNIRMSGDKIQITESKYKFLVNGDSTEGDIKKVMEGLEMNNTPEQIANLISVLLSNFDLINFMDSVTTFDPEYSDDTVDMMQGDNVVFVVVDDAQGLMGDVISGEPDEMADKVANELGIDIKGALKDEDINEDEQEIEDEGELLDLENDLEIVEANLKKIAELDEEFKQDDDIKELERELTLEKETIVKRIAEIKDGINEEGDDKDSIIKNIIDQLQKLLSPETAQAATDEKPEASADGEPVKENGISITPFVRYNRKDNEISFASMVGLEGLNDTAKQRIIESKKFDIVPESNLVIKLTGEKELKDEITEIVESAFGSDVYEPKERVLVAIWDDEKGSFSNWDDSVLATVVSDEGDEVKLVYDDDNDGNVESVSKDAVKKADIHESGPADDIAIEQRFDKDKIAELSKWASENGDDEVDTDLWLGKAVELFGEDKAKELAQIYGL